MKACRNKLLRPFSEINETYTTIWAKLISQEYRNISVLGITMQAAFKCQPIMIIARVIQDVLR